MSHEETYERPGHTTTKPLVEQGPGVPMTVPDARVAINPEALIQIAIERNIEPASMQALLDMRRELKAEQAREAYFAAMEGFQSEVPAIGKTKRADMGPGKPGWNFAPYDVVEKTIRPYREKWGINHSFSQEYVDGKIHVTCTVRHREGHEETSDFTAPIDDKNPVSSMHKSASSTSFAKRNALINAYSLVTTEDDDGVLGGTKKITDEQAADLRAMADEVGAHHDRFLSIVMKVDRYEDIAAKDLNRAVTALEAKRDQQAAKQ